MSTESDELRQVVTEARKEIDRIDRELVRLLNRRAAEAVKIGEVKRTFDEPIYQPEREEEIFRQVQAENQGPLEDQALRRLFERILDEARRLERSP